MVNRLLNVLVAEDAVRVVANIIVSPLQHVASVEPVMKQKPAKYFDFHSALRFPKLTECLMRLPVPKIVVIVVRWFVNRRAPRIVPNII